MYNLLCRDVIITLDILSPLLLLHHKHFHMLVLMVIVLNSFTLCCMLTSQHDFVYMRGIKLNALNTFINLRFCMLFC